MEKIGICVLHPGNDITCGINCDIHISLMDCREHNSRFSSNGRIQICKSIRKCKGITLPPAYPNKFSFQLPTLLPDWGDKGVEGKQKIATKMSAWIMTILVIIALLAILYTIFQKCRYVSSLPRVCFPLYPFSTIL